MQERIICAANWYHTLAKQEHTPKNIDRGVVIGGLRHPFIINTMYSLTGIKTGSNCIQGFLTNEHRFVDRVEGRKIALAAGQITEDSYHETELFSEDLY